MGSVAAEIVHALGGRNGVCKCPAHDDRSPSLTIKDNSNGGITVHCFAGCDWRDVKAELRRMGLLPEFNGEEVPTESGQQRRAKQEADEREKAKKITWAKAIWKEAHEARNSPVEAYLRGRGINNLPSTIRYHANLRHTDTGQYFPAMVAAISKWPSRDVTGIHRTYLQTGGRGKANVSSPKKMAGCCAGGAVRLAPAGETIAIAEGIETALSVQQATGIPTWAALSTSGIKTLVLPELPLAGEVVIAADNDSPGIAAANEAAHRWTMEGRRVRIAIPLAESDFNDLTNRIEAAVT
jgi:putative DNA primase/helicase